MTRILGIYADYCCFDFFICDHLFDLCYLRAILWNTDASTSSAQVTRIWQIYADFYLLNHYHYFQMKGQKFRLSKEFVVRCSLFGVWGLGIAKFNVQ